MGVDGLEPPTPALKGPIVRFRDLGVSVELDPYQAFRFWTFLSSSGRLGLSCGRDVDANLRAVQSLLVKVECVS